MSGSPADLAYHPGYLLRVQTLGQFRVWRGDDPVAEHEWQREKARHLFQLLLIHRGRLLQREQIVEQLWPQLDPQAAENHFKVALNALQHVLEPDRPPRAPAFFVQRQGTAYRLNPTAAIELDITTFERLISEAAQMAGTQPQPASELYRQALDLYTGDFLPDCLYEDWTSAERERLQVLALGTMTTLAELSVERCPLESLRLTQRVLTIDPIWEDAYRIQMRAFLVQGNRPLALRTYERCVEVLEREFGVEPLPETRELYEEIRRKG
jgi:DNA-binding SARP family transcriptional activator